jgi:adenine-specific DNA methylase
MGRACGTCGRGDFYAGFWRRTLKERDLLVDLGLKGKNIKTDHKEIVWEGWTGIDLAWDRAK